MLSQAFTTNNKDRLINARKNRQLQLERWDHFEKENNKVSSNGSRRTNGRNIQFSKNIILLEAVSRNDIKEVADLLKQGVDPNSTTIDGLTGLHQCCIDDYLDMGALLLKYNANVNACDSEMWTPLHAAATCGNVEMCKLLIKYDADFLAINADGNMPYDICEGSDTLTVVETEMAKKNITQEQIDQARLVPEQTMMISVKHLIEMRDNLDHFDSQGATLLHIACSLGFNDVVCALLEAGANHSQPDREGWMPIHIAACWNYLDIVENLVVFGANIDEMNSNGDTVFEICEPQFKERLFHIKNHVESIRKNFDFKRYPQGKSFRKSRGSSIRRTSVRHKNMMSRKEAKEEFLTMNQPGVSQCDDKNEEIIERVNEEENSDIDSYVGSDHQKNNNSLHNKEISTTRPAIHIIKSDDHSKSNAIGNSQSPRISTPKAKKAAKAPAPPAVVEVHSETENIKPNNNGLPTSKEEKIPEVQSENPSVQSPAVSNNGLDALNHPRYVYSSTTENWDVNNSNKKTRRRKCCVML